MWMQAVCQGNTPVCYNIIIPACRWQYQIYMGI
jgi:hypothetical protein